MSLYHESTDSLEGKLRDLDRQRDHLRAVLADTHMRETLTKIDREVWVAADMREKRKADMTAKIALREARRAKEYQRYCAYVRPGAWDEDLDKYQEPKYEEDVGEGYKIRLTRCPDLT